MKYLSDERHDLIFTPGFAKLLTRELHVDHTLFSQLYPGYGHLDVMDMIYQKWLGYPGTVDSNNRAFSYRSSRCKCNWHCRRHPWCTAWLMKTDRTRAAKIKVA